MPHTHTQFVGSNSCCILKLWLIFHYWAEKRAEQDRANKGGDILYFRLVSPSRSQPPLGAAFWVFHHFADQLFDSDAVYCFSWDMNLTELWWINNKWTTEDYWPRLLSFIFLFFHVHLAKILKQPFVTGNMKEQPDLSKWHLNNEMCYQNRSIDDDALMNLKIWDKWILTCM